MERWERYTKGSRVCKGERWERAMQRLLSDKLPYLIDLSFSCFSSAPGTESGPRKLLSPAHILPLPTMRKRDLILDLGVGLPALRKLYRTSPAESTP